MKSPRLRDLLKAATIGLTDEDVVQQTGLGFSLWRKMLTGDASVRALLQFCAGFGLRAEPYLLARVETGPIDETAVMRTALEITTLPQPDKRELMEEFMRRQQVVREQEAAA
jgi:hypothetical protein